jgi:hypothetical protein
MFLTSISSIALPPLSTLLKQNQPLARRLQSDFLFMQKDTSAPPVNEQTFVQSQNTIRPKLITHPMPNDVLFGRGRPLQAHHGNLRFHRIVNKFREEYKKARKDDKVGTAETHVTNAQHQTVIFLLILDEPSSPP